MDVENAVIDNKKVPLAKIMKIKTKLFMVENAHKQGV